MSSEQQKSEPLTVQLSKMPSSGVQTQDRAAVAELIRRTNETKVRLVGQESA